MTLLRHRLQLAKFDELAAGFGGLAAELNAGQLSKRLLRILAVLEEISARYPDTFVAGGFAESYAELAAARQQSKALVDKVLLHPFVGAWAAHALRRLVSTGAGDTALDDDLGHFGAIAAAANLAVSRSFDLTLRIRADGSLMLPTYGLSRPGPATKWDARWCRARYRSGAASLELELDGQCSDVPVRSPAGTACWSPVRKLTSLGAGIRIDVELDDVDPFRDSHRLGAANRLPANEIAAWQASLDEAWAVLTSQQETLAVSLSAGITTLVPLAGPDRGSEFGQNAGISVTIGDAAGAVALTRPPDGTALAATLVHEFQHSKLSALLDLVPLHRAGPAATYYAPWRADPRPLHGLLHGAYAHLALVEFWQHLRRAGTGASSRLANFEFARWRRALRLVLRTLDGSGLLTVYGDRFVSRMRRQLAGMRPVAAPADIDTLARDALIDHWLTWRMRNLHPNPAWLAAATQAWLTGRRCPPTPSTPPGPEVAGCGSPPITSARRLELTYRRLKDPQLFAAEYAGPSAASSVTITADASLIGGNHSTAARLYQQAVFRDPDRADWWVGLALAHRRLGTTTGRAFTGHPERLAGLARQVRSVTGSIPDVTALAAWFMTAQE